MTEFLLVVALLSILGVIYTKETFTFVNKIPCKKWIGILKKSPSNICKDCGYPTDCHGPYKGDSWRHVFQETPL
jgi:hypothetical protein